MSERFKPEISVVRHNAMHRGAWNNEDGIYPDEPRALLIRGVPMVGERVRHDGLHHPKAPRKDFVVHGYEVLLVDENDVPWEVEDCAPVPDEDESLVERVVDAITRACLDRGSLYDIARVAVRAMKEKK